MASAIPSNTDASEMDTANQLEDTIRFLEDLLERRGRHGQRVMSPLTEATAKALLKICKTEDIADQSHQTAETLCRMKEEMERRLDTDAKYKDAMKKMNQMHKAHFLIQYGDYYAIYLGDLRREVRRANRKAQERETMLPEVADTEASATITFMREPWAEIDNVLKKEDELILEWEDDSGSSPRPATPMSDLIRKVSVRSQGFDIKRTRAIIAAYAARNSMAHASLAVLAREGEFHQLAKKMENELLHLRVERRCE